MDSRIPPFAPATLPAADPIWAPPVTPREGQVPAPRPGFAPAPPRPPGRALAQRASRRPKWTGLAKKLTTGQFLCWEVAVLAVALSLGRPWPVVAAAVFVAATLMLLTVTRLRGHWLYELVALGCGFMVRTRRHDLPEHSGRALALLGALLPGSATRTVETGQGPIMTISSRHGLTAIARPRTLTSEQISAFPTPGELLGDGQEFGMQAVFHAGAQPGTPIRSWLAVHAPRTVEMASDEELALSLRNRLRRIRQALRRAGVVIEPLPEDVALAELTGLAHITGGRTEIRESWSAWRTGTVSQACFLLENTGGHDVRRLVTAVLGASRGVAVTVTLSAPPASGARSASPLLRLAAVTESAIEAAANRITTVLSPYGAHLTRLDGTHASGVAASLPIGGFLR